MTPPRKPLRAVQDGETAAPKGSVTVAGAATTRELLVAMKNRIAKAIDDPNTPARDLAALTKRIGEVVRELDAIDERDAEGAVTVEAGDEAFDSSAL